MELVVFFVATLCVMGICYLIGRNYSMRMSGGNSDGAEDDSYAIPDAEAPPEEDSVAEAPPEDVEAGSETTDGENPNTEQET